MRLKVSSGSAVKIIMLSCMILMIFGCRDKTTADSIPLNETQTAGTSVETVFENIKDSEDAASTINKSLGQDTRITFRGTLDDEICFEDNIIITKDIVIEGDFNSIRNICLKSDFIVEIKGKQIIPTKCRYEDCKRTGESRDGTDKLADLIDSADKKGRTAIIDKGLSEKTETCFKTGHIIIDGKKIDGNFWAEESCYYGRLKVRAFKDNKITRLEVLEWCGDSVCSPFEECQVDCN